MGIVCQQSTGAQYNVLWYFAYPDCRQRVVFCKAGVGAYVPAITVCIQGLYTF